jgi:hypothetical protein
VYDRVNFGVNRGTIRFSNQKNLGRHAGGWEVMDCRDRSRAETTVSMGCGCRVARPKGTTQIVYCSLPRLALVSQTVD